MPYQSMMYPNEVIIDDTQNHQYLSNPMKGTGLELPRDHSYEGTASSFPSNLLIDPSEWEARIAEKEAKKNRLSDLINQAGLPCKDQGQTNFCWCNGPVHCCEVGRVIQNQTMVLFSPASVACPINGFRNEGGWGKQALDQIIKAGMVPVSQWPANAISRQYYTEENKQLAQSYYKVTKWIELDGRNLNQLISLLLQNIAVAGGYTWWSHEITVVDAVWVNGKIGTRIRNSWGMNWPNEGAGGYSILQGSKMYPDDQVAPLVEMAA